VRRYNRAFFETATQAIHRIGELDAGQEALCKARQERETSSPSDAQVRRLQEACQQAEVD
jgi:hypothetical protein